MFQRILKVARVVQMVWNDAIIMISRNGQVSIGFIQSKGEIKIRIKTKIPPEYHIRHDDQDRGGPSKQK